jgi:hypothetical protein
MVDMAQSSADLMNADGGWSAAQAVGGLGAATLGMAIPGTAKGISEGVEDLVTVYHGTTKEAADRIRKSGYLKSAGEPHVYFTSDPTGGGYGDGSVLAVQVPRSKLQLDDEFPDGRQDFSVDVRRPGGGMAVKVLPETPPDPQGIRAYHGSPHDFDAFSMDKIGTGEGAQAYGHGLYFAEGEDVAQSYKEGTRLTNVTMKGVPFHDMGQSDKIIARTVNRLGIDGALKWFKEQGASADLVARMRALKLKDGDVIEPAGHMYEVNINANPDDFLDWDKPLSEQSEKVRGVAHGKGLSWGETKEAMSDRLVGMGLTRQEADEYAAANFYDSTGAMAYRELGDKDTATAALREAGVPGIRYLDQGSRAAGDGSRNYVVFDQDIITILRKYGLLGAVGLGGAVAITPDQEMTPNG